MPNFFTTVSLRLNLTPESLRELLLDEWIDEWVNKMFSPWIIQGSCVESNNWMPFQSPTFCFSTEDCFLKSQKSIWSPFSRAIFLESNIWYKYEKISSFLGIAVFFKTILYGAKSRKMSVSQVQCRQIASCCLMKRKWNWSYFVLLYK